MKTILKLIILGVIAGGTYKYMTDNDITLTEVFNSLNEKASNIIAKIEKTNSSATQSSQRKEASYYKPEQNNSSHRTNTTNTSSTVTSKAKPMDKPISFPVEKRVTSNPKLIKLDYHAINAPESYSTDIPTLVRYLVEPANNDLEKVRTIFTWIAHNIYYDDYGYNTGNYADGSAQGVFTNRRSVCNGYAELFKAMVEEVGLEVVKISGYAKGYGLSQGKSLNRTNHAWNAVNINGNWKLFDVTWGHGSGKRVNGRLQSVKKFNDFWFDTDPYIFIFSHLPENPQWQLINNQLSKVQFKKLPYVQSSFFALGFNGKSILKELLNGELHNLPDIYGDSKHIQAISLPASGNLKNTQPIRIEIKSTAAYDMAVINNGEWTYFEKNNDIYSLTIHPQRGELKVSARFNSQSTSYNTLIAYRVK